MTLLSRFNLQGEVCLCLGALQMPLYKAFEGEFFRRLFCWL